MIIFIVTYFVSVFLLVNILVVGYLRRDKNNLKDKRIRAAYVLLSFVWPVMLLATWVQIVFDTVEILRWKYGKKA